ncbi:DUF2075 domain-containing protein [Bisgaard Taxon 46]
MNRSYYQNTIAEFLLTADLQIFAELTKHNEHELGELQKNAWLYQIKFLKQNLIGLDGKIYFEYIIPRMGKRVDNILIIDDLILVIEFKIGDKKYHSQAQDQTIDYCLDLLNFHSSSHNKCILPILVSTEANDVKNELEVIKKLKKPLRCNSQNFKANLCELLRSKINKIPIDIQAWENGVYKPTPTIIEAAQAFYKGHNVKEISRSDASAINLSATTDSINKIIEHSKKYHKKSICFITGVPGAGKTLAGLNIAAERLKADESEHAVFLSGNGPLVDVLRESLARDAVTTAKSQNTKLSKSESVRKAKTFIQNIHHFRDDNLRDNKPPIEKVVVYDEAQRAWHEGQLAQFMKKKKGINDFLMSEPKYLIQVMDRHEDWCVIVCLIGGGQEINTGEAGLSEWIESLKASFTNWEIYYSDKLQSEHSTYLNDPKLVQWLSRYGHKDSNLHLAVSLRSFRSEKVSLLIQYLLNDQSEDACKIYQSVTQDYPIYLTRDLDKAKQWLKERARGSERIGIIASSGGIRLKAAGIYVKNEISPVNWFLNGKEDVRSSYYLEDIATEFDVQGLEIEFSCVAWDINFYYEKGWKYQQFKGATWQNIHKSEDRQYLLNSYRVLLTRARQGMVIFVPESVSDDLTRPSEKYDAIFEYLKSCGFGVI